LTKFSFKNFDVNQDRCAMKIGTDGVLLGAWSPIFNNPYSVLDIGAGTGILAIMIAQRSFAEQIDAIEIDEDAFEQCVENFENTNWSNRLYCYHAALDEFVDEMKDEKYDLIISNPPFYSENYKTDNTQRDLARFTDAMPFNELIEAVSVLLSDDGMFSTIIPFKEEASFIDVAESFGLYPFKITRVKGTPTSDIKRSLLAFSKLYKVNETDELVIEISRHNYTKDYIELTKEFYLKF